MSYRTDIEDKNWRKFLDWLSGTGFDPRNGEHIDTLFWYWWIKTEDKSITENEEK